MTQMSNDGRWTVDAARQWAARAGWLVGCNFIPSTAINQLEMWQPETFDISTIDRELGLAAGLGMNSVRVFLHDLLWAADPGGLCLRMEAFLAAATRHGIGTVFVLFDSVWNPMPEPGRQPAPQPGKHNSGWVQSPGAAVLADERQWGSLHDYVTGLIAHFATDERIHAWDLVNEPDNTNRPLYSATELPNKRAQALALVGAAFDWAREARPSQPVTVGVWSGNWGAGAKVHPVAALSLAQSDIISFHDYGDLEAVTRSVAALEEQGRPLLCTEYMARSQGSTFNPILGFFKSHQIGAYNWGLVAGKTQTQFPWDSWAKDYAADPVPWFHEIFRSDGAPYDVEEARYIRSLTTAR